LLSLAGIQLLDHGAPPQHQLNGCSTVLLLNLFLQQLPRVAALQYMSKKSKLRACAKHHTLRS
jgi:hypothetical protein